MMGIAAPRIAGEFDQVWVVNKTLGEGRMTVRRRARWRAASNTRRPTVQRAITPAIIWPLVEEWRPTG